MAKNQTLCNKNAYGCDKRMTEISGNISEITLWKESTIQPKLVEMDNFLTNFAAKFDGIIKNVEKQALTKLERIEGQEMQRKFEERMADFDNRLYEVKDSVLTLEHYCERYIPVQIQQMIINNMQMILTNELQDKMDLLLS